MLSISSLLARRDSFCSTHFRRDKEEYGLPHVVIWLWQLACALCALRKANMIHQDVKPDNILLMPTEYEFAELVLADFGVVRKIVEEGSGTGRKTAEDESGAGMKEEEKGSCDAGGSLMPTLSIGKNTNNVGRTGADHVSIEIRKLADLFSESVQEHADQKWMRNDKQKFLKFSERVAGDVGKFMSQYIIDESSDMCK